MWLSNAFAKIITEEEISYHTHVTKNIYKIILYQYTTQSAQLPILINFPFSSIEASLYKVHPIKEGTLVIPLHRSLIYYF
jgi:hypothetical protein